MITSVTIEGFKSFGSPAKPISLSALNFIVGANASGKTNFVSALKFLQLSVTHGLDRAVNEFGGSRDVLNRILRERKNGKSVAISIRLRGPLPDFKVSETEAFCVHSAFYRLEIGFEPKTDNPFVIKEELEAEIHNSKKPRFLYSLQRDRDTIRVNDPGNEARPEHTTNVPPTIRSQLAIEEWSLGLPALWFKQWVAGWRFFNISSETARLSAKEAVGVELGAHGENLAAILHEIEADDDDSVMAKILSGLRGAVPSIQKIKTQRLEVEDKWSFQIFEERIKGLNPRSASDGTIRLLALLVATYWSGRSSSLVVIEEPENNLHPHLCEQMVSMFRAVSEDRQIVVTTHSSGFLKDLEPNELLLCERDEETFTQLIPASSRENIDIFRRRYTLGELWVQGALGGIPQ